MCKSIFCAYLSRIIRFLRTNAIAVFQYVVWDRFSRRSNLMYVVVWSLSKIWMAALILPQQLWPSALKRSPTVHVFLSVKVLVFETDYGREKAYCCATQRWEKYVFSWGGFGILILSSEKSVGPPLRFNEKNSWPPTFSDWQKCDPPLTTTWYVPCHRNLRTFRLWM